MEAPTAKSIIKRIIKNELTELLERRRELKSKRINSKHPAFADMSRMISERRGSLRLLKVDKLAWAEIPGKDGEPSRYLVGRTVDDETIAQATERIRQLNLQPNNTNVRDDSSIQDPALRESGDSPVPGEDGSAQDPDPDRVESASVDDPEL